MELVFITHGNILTLQYLAPWLSWPIVLGGFYGAARFLWILGRGAWWALSSIVLATQPPADRKPPG